MGWRQLWGTNGLESGAKKGQVERQLHTAAARRLCTNASAHRAPDTGTPGHNPVKNAVELLLFRIPFHILRPIRTDEEGHRDNVTAREKALLRYLS